MNSFIFSFSFLFLLTCSYAQESSELIVQQGSVFHKTLNENDPIYFVSSSPTGSNVCTIDEPTYGFTYYSQEFQQVNPTEYLNQTYVVGVNNMVYVLLRSGVFKAFNVSFKEDQTSQLALVDEIWDLVSDLADDLQTNQFVGLLYEEFSHNLLVLTQNLIVFINVNADNKLFWLETSSYTFPDSTAGDIIYAKCLNGNVYILRNNSVFEVWKILSNSTTGFYLVKKNTVSLMQEFINDFQKLGADVVDFEINDFFFYFLEKNSMSLYLINYTAGFQNLQSKVLKKMTFTQKPLRIELTSDSLFVLLSNTGVQATLYKYDLTSNLPLSTSFPILGTFNDLYIGEDFFIASYPTYAELTPHSFNSPQGVNPQLKMRIDVQGLNLVQPFIITKTPKFIPFQFFKDSIIQFMKIDLQPPVIKCDLTNINPGVYTQNFVFYRLPCFEVDYKCDRSLSYSESMQYKVTVVPPGLMGFNVPHEILIYKVVVIVLSVALAIVLVLLIIGLVWFCRIVRPQQGQFGKYVERIMSKEELKIMGSTGQSDQELGSVSQVGRPNQENL